MMMSLAVEQLGMGIRLTALHRDRFLTEYAWGDAQPHR